MLLIHELSDNQDVASYSLVKKLQIRLKKNGDPYLRLTLSDRTGKIEAVLWTDAEAVAARIDEGSIVRYRGAVERYNGVPQLTLRSIEEVDPSREANGFRPEELMEVSPLDVDRMWGELSRVVETETRRDCVRRLLRKVISSHSEQFRSFPAAVEIHHDYRGGFLEHVLSVLRSVLFFADKHPSLDRDLLIAGAILHDIGKFLELSGPGNPSYTASGQLIGHIVLGRDLLREQAARIPGFPPNLLLLLEHMILSHQGQLEWGSPKRPMIPEALVLHYMDDLDAKLNRFFGLIRDTPGDGEFTAHDRHLGRALFRGDYEGAAHHSGVEAGRQSGLFDS